MLLALVVPIGLIAAAAQQVADSWRLASLGSLIATCLSPFGSLKRHEKH